jgi:hypothetical protein
MNSTTAKGKTLIITSLILIFFLIILILVKSQIDRQMRLATRAERPAEEREEVSKTIQETPVLPLPTDYQKGVPQEALNPSQNAGEIKVINSPQVVRKIKLDTTTPFKRELTQLLKSTLKEMGYSLTIYNQEAITPELILPDSTAPAGSFSSGCTKYGFRWDATKGMIEVFFFIDQPQETCTPDKFTAPIINAVGQAKGQVFEWWKNGLEKVSKEQGRKADLPDFPFGIE